MFQPPLSDNEYALENSSALGSTQSLRSAPPFPQDRETFAAVDTRSAWDTEALANLLERVGSRPPNPNIGQMNHVLFTLLLDLEIFWLDW